MLNLAIFASGAGSNLVAIHQSIRRGELDARISMVLSNNSQSGALQYAREQDIAAIHHSTKTESDPDAFVRRMLQILKDHEVQVIALAGYMKLVPPEIIRSYAGRITNIHPALLPLFGGKGMYGIRVHEAVIASGVNESGATVHIVDEIFDNGPIILQKAIPVLPDDTPETLAIRVLTIEHEIYPRALQLFAEERIHYRGNNLIIEEKIHSS